MVACDQLEALAVEPNNAESLQNSHRASCIPRSLRSVHIRGFIERKIPLSLLGFLITREPWGSVPIYAWAKKSRQTIRFSSQ